MNRTTPSVSFYLVEGKALASPGSPAMADEAAVAEKAEQAAKAAAELAAVKPEPTEEERKLARDARYAARKNRK